MKDVRVDIVTSNGYGEVGRVTIDHFDTWNHFLEKSSDIANIAKALDAYTHDHEGFMPSIEVVTPTGVHWFCFYEHSGVPFYLEGKEN